MPSDREGPAVVVIERLSCRGCRWHGPRMMWAGDDPLYEYFCKHPGAKAGASHFFDGIIGDDGRYIGPDGDTPGWCPVLRKEAADGH